jgi:hypothetical protein
MTNEAFLLKSESDKFIGWLNDKGIPWRSGKGDYQLMQIYHQKTWHPLYISTKFPNHYKAIGNLASLVIEFHETVS